MKVKIGTVLVADSDSYVIKSRVDAGGNGTVWKAEKQGDCRTYAVKILNSGTNDEKLARFRRGCQFCKESDHKHIIKVFDYVAESGIAYCVMPYYPKNLRTIIDEENDSFVLLSYIIQLCEAIRFIHNCVIFFMLDRVYVAYREIPICVK